MLSSSCRYLVFLIWVGAVYACAVLLFTQGFLLRRQVLPNRTECTGLHCTPPPRLYSKAVILLVDALKHDFCVYNSSLTRPGWSENRLPVLSRLARPDPVTGQARGKLYRFIADPPTTTMQRLKGLTTGSLPTFIDMSSNFASHAVEEDNIIDQLVRHGRRVVFAGDDTWTSLYPGSFTQAFPQPSFQVWDLDSVDRAVRQQLNSHLATPQHWDVFIGHFLGVDHAGHKFGPDHPEMGRKLGEMDSVVEEVAARLPPDTLLLVFGDHGMTAAGDHGGDSQAELQAGLFVYSPGLGLVAGNREAVAQIDLVPSLALLLGVPIPFSSLGSIIEDLFVPPGRGFSQENLVNFRLPYVKTNVHQVYRYLTAYLAQGGSFPELASQRVRSLANQVINRPGALSPRQLSELLSSCRNFLMEARSMCQAVWVEFELAAMGCGLQLLLLHSCVLLLLLLRPAAPALPALLSCSLLAAAWLAGTAAAVAAHLVTGWNVVHLHLAVPPAASLLAQALSLLWRLRRSLLHMARGVAAAARPAAVFPALLTAATVLPAFSNSFVVLQARLLSFTLVSGVVWQVWSCRHLTARRPVLLAGLLILGLTQATAVYVRCREEEGPDCPYTDYHKPLATLSASAGSYKNWRYAVSLASLLSSCGAAHLALARAGNLNGISLPVLVAKFIPWLMALLISGYWALQAFPTSLVSSLLPWQQNLLARLVPGLALLALFTLTASPVLTYLEPRRARRPVLGTAPLPAQPTVASYYAALRAGWRGSTPGSPQPGPLCYGLGSCLTAVVGVATLLLGLLSALLAGDGLCPAVCAHLAVHAALLVLTAPARLAVQQSGRLFSVPSSAVLLWFLKDCLSFYQTGHQPTFPHIQWSAAFVGLAGEMQLGGPAWISHVLPAVMVGWNTYCGTVLSCISLPLLLFSPACLWLLLPACRPARSAKTQELDLELDFHSDLDRGEAIYLERAEETRAGLVTLCLQFTGLKAARLTGAAFAAAILRRHLMVWKIFAPNLIFEAVGFLVSLVSLLAGFLIASRVLSVMSRYFCKMKKL